MTTSDKKYYTNKKVKEIVENMLHDKFMDIFEELGDAGFGEDHPLTKAISKKFDQICK